MFDKKRNKFVNERQFGKIKKMLDDYYGFHPQTLSYDKILARYAKHTSESRKRTAVTSLLHQSEQKTKMTKLERFINTYNYYIHKLLWSGVDSFLAHKRKKYQEKCEKNKLNKYANVFNRLTFDTNERKRNDEEIKKDLESKY